MPIVGGTARMSLFLTAVALVSALALAAARPALATTNLVPNPGFETNCSGIPCNWVASGFPASVSITRDTTLALAGSASMKMTMTGTGNFGSSSSSCVTAAIAAGPHDVSLSYLTSDTRVSSVELAARFFSGANCTGLFSDAGSGTQTTANGAWNAFLGTITSPAASSAVFALNMTTSVAGTTPSVNIDNVDFESEVVAVTLASFSAARSHRGVALHWRTGTQVNELGFNVYRQQGGRRVRVNRRLLPTIGNGAGASYSFTDHRAPRHRALRYWLQDVDVAGTRTWHGPVRVAAS
jgi:hypothetical protein